MLHLKDLEQRWEVTLTGPEHVSVLRSAVTGMGNSE